MTVQFEVVGSIKTKQRPRARVVNHKYAQVYTPQETIMYENYIRSEYQRQVKNGYFGQVPLAISVVAYFEPSAKLKERMEQLSKYMNLENKVICTTHKDFDNIYKIVCDSLNGIAYEDDKQIWSDLGFTKYYSLGQERLLITLSDDIDYDDILTEENINHYYIQSKIHERKLAKKEKLQNKDKLTKKEHLELRKLLEESDEFLNLIELIEG